MIKGLINNIVVSKSSIQCDMSISGFSGRVDTISRIFKDWSTDHDQALYIQISITSLYLDLYSVQFHSMDNTNMLMFNVNMDNKRSSLTDEKINNSYFGRMIYMTFMNKILPILVEKIKSFT